MVVSYKNSPVRYRSGAMQLIDVAVVTHPGRQRKENQDYASYAAMADPSNDQADMFLAVADGMGGHAGGAVAAKMAVEILEEAYGQSGASSVSKRLHQAFKKANAVLMRRSHRDPELKGMGTTLTAVVIRDADLFYAHVGDSRGYIFADGDLQQFTSDHSLVADLVKRGVIRAEEAEHHPKANVITRAIGFSADLEVEVGQMALAAESSLYLLLCSDGLYKEVGDDTMRTILSKSPEPKAAGDALVALANEGGGSDNITVLVARVANLPQKPNWLARLRGV